MKTKQVIFVACLALLLAVSAKAAGPTKFYAVTPCRLVDTRFPPFGTPITTGAPFTFRVVGTCGVPLSAVAVFLTVTAVSPTDGGYIVVYPNPGSFPGTSLVNVDAGERALGNGGIFVVGTDPSLQLTAVYGTCCGHGTTHLAVDVMGYYTP
jgi:hypothetical protein